MLGTLLADGRAGAGGMAARVTGAEEMAACGIALVRHLSEEAGTRVSLQSLGVKECDLSMLAEKAMKDGCIATSPVIPDLEQVIGIYKKAWEGDRDDGTC